MISAAANTRHLSTLLSPQVAGSGLQHLMPHFPLTSCLRSSSNGTNKLQRPLRHTRCLGRLLAGVRLRSRGRGRTGSVDSYRLSNESGEKKKRRLVPSSVVLYKTFQPTFPHGGSASFFGVHAASTRTNPPSMTCICTT